MALSTAQQSIVQFTVGMFNAAPGKLFLDELTATGRTVAQLGADLSVSSYFTDIYPTSQSNEAFVKAFLDNLIGSTLSAEVRESSEAFLEGQLNAGQTRPEMIVVVMISFLQPPLIMLILVLLLKPCKTK